MNNYKSNSLLEFKNNPKIISYAAVGGPIEKEGPLGGIFDYIFDNPLAGKKTWEQAESELQKKSLEIAFKKSGLSSLDVVFAGDLLNQCVGSTFGLMEYKIPFVGVYGACSTMALSTIMASVMVDGGYAANSAAVST